MKRKAKRFLLLVAIITIAYIAGYASATIRYWPKPERPCVEKHANDTIVETIEDVDKILESGE